MTLRFAAGVFFFGLLLLAVALLLPSAVGGVDDRTNTTERLSEGSEIDLTESLNLTLSNVSSINSDIEISLNNSDNFNSTEINDIAVGTNKTGKLDGNNVTVYNHEVVDSTTARFTVEYSPLFSWASGPRLFIESLGPVLGIIAVLVSLGGVFVGVRNV